MRCGLILALLGVCWAAWAEVPEGWFEFVISELAEDSVANVSAHNATVAGADGFVTIRDGHFVDAKGERIRFLATNLTFDDAFPDKDRAPEIARRMAALGINCVRFHHMDCHHSPRGIWDPAYEDRQHVDAAQLDRLDWIIYQLKQHGIYTNLNLHVSRKFREADGFEKYDERPKYDKGLDNFEPRMVELQKQYARDLLTHVNPYTKTAYVDEPCVAMVELNNENSALRYAMGTTLHKLPEPYLGQLRALWMAWLKENCATTAALETAWDEGSQPLGEEMLRNADFAQGTDEWRLETPKPAEGMMEVIADPELGKVLHAQLTALGEKSWHFQVHQVGHTLEDGKLYTVSFKVKASPARTIHVSARYDIADWRGVGLSEQIDVNEQWQEFSFTFRAKEPLPEHTRLSFNNTNKLGEVWLTEISLRPGGRRGLPEEQSLEAENVELPLASATAQGRSDWFAFVMELERRYTHGMRDFLKQDLGLHAQVVDTQATYGGIGGVWRESQMDYVDVHAYWQHPRFPNKPWDGNDWYIPNTPMTAALGSDTLTRLAQYRVAGMAYTVSEYNHPAPNDYRAECMPMLAAFAGLQDWDGIFQFCYGEQPEDWSEAAIQGYFRMACDPAKLAFFPVAANLFRRGDVRVAPGELTLLVPRGRLPELVLEHANGTSGMWEQVGVECEEALRRKLAIEFVDADKLQVRALENLGWQGDPEVRWSAAEDDGGVFAVDTAKTKLVLGPVAGQTLELGEVRFEVGQTETGWAALALTSMDDRPISESARMLLVVMSGAENQEMGWDEKRTTVKRAWGKGPSIAEGVEATITLAGRDGLAAYVLDGTGTRGQKVAADERAASFSVGPQYRTVWYEIAGE